MCINNLNFIAFDTSFEKNVKVDKKVATQVIKWERQNIIS